MANDYQHKDGTGALFKNARKDKPTQPDYRGDFMLNGVTYEIASWLKDGKNGKFMSLSVKPKEDRQEGKVWGAQQASPADSPSLDDFDDSLIPF